MNWNCFTLSLAALYTDFQSVGVPQVCSYCFANIMSRSRKLESRGIIHFRTPQVSDFVQSVRYRALLFFLLLFIIRYLRFWHGFCCKKGKNNNIKIRNYMETMIKLTGFNRACRETVMPSCCFFTMRHKSNKQIESCIFLMDDKLKISN